MQTLRQPLITDAQRPYVAEVAYFNSFLPHSHDELEIILLLAGEVNYTIDGTEYHLKVGDAAVVAPNLIHTTAPPQEFYAEGILVECGFALFGEDYELLRESCFPEPIQHLLCPDNPYAERLKSLLIRILPELTQDSRLLSVFGIDSRPINASGLANQSAQRAVLYELFTWLVREFPRCSVSSEGLPQPQRLRWSEVFDYISAHYREPIRVDQTASLAGYSVYHFSRCFRDYTGFPFHRYLNRYRVEKASLLLSGSNMAVTQIAEMTGFESIKTFNRVFRQETGESPSSYRAKQHERYTSPAAETSTKGE